MQTIETVKNKDSPGYLGPLVWMTAGGHNFLWYQHRSRSTNPSGARLPVIRIVLALKKLDFADEWRTAEQLRMMRTEQ